MSAEDKRINIARPEKTGLKGCLVLALAVFAFVSQSMPSVAQIDPTGMLQEGLVVEGKGWAQLTDFQEMSQFLLGLIEVTIMTAAIAYHPSARVGRRAADYQVPRTLFVYALIGMVVGFLVMNHGSIIGFVIFGIGGLLRFRTDVDTMSDTMRLILVTLIGLCIGLDLPVMALITTASSLAIIHFLGGAPHYTLDVKFTGKASLVQAMAEFEARLKDLGFSVVGVNKSKSKSKHSLTYVLAGSNAASIDVLTREMLVFEADETTGISDWHLG